MNESLMYGSEDEYNAVTLMLSLTTFGIDPINAWGENTSTFSEVILSKQVISMNQESPSL